MQVELVAIAPRSSTNRAKITNDPRKLLGSDGRKREGRRRRDLVSIFLDSLGGRAAATELQLVIVRKAAELTVAAETARARLLTGDVAVNLEALVKLEGEARRAVRALGIKSGGRKPAPTLADYLASRTERGADEHSEETARG